MATAIAGTDGATPGLGLDATTAAAAGTTALAPPSFFKSLMFLAISVARTAASLSARSLAIFASPVLVWTDPLDSVSLSGVTAVVFLSSTLASMAPLVLRAGAATAATGALVARLRRNSLKSLLCAITVWVATAAESAWACSVLGTSSTAPERMRLMLLLTKASGLARSKATNI